MARPPYDGRAETLVDYADDDRDIYILSDPAPVRGHDEEARVRWEIRRGRPVRWARRPGGTT